MEGFTHRGNRIADGKTASNILRSINPILDSFDPIRLGPKLAHCCPAATTEQGFKFFNNLVLIYKMR